MTITVPAAPLGPQTPSGGWAVEFADGFGLPLVNGNVQSNRSRTDVDPFWAFLGVGTFFDGFNANEIACFVDTQISQDSRGLVLTAAYHKNYATSSKYGTVYNYISAAIQSTLEATANGFRWMPGGGSTLAFEINCKMGQNFDGGPTSGGNDEGWWTSGGGWKDEFDFFEHWGWRGPPGVLADVWVYDTSGPHTVSITDSSVGGVAKWLGADPGTTYHTYTTVINPDNSFDWWIDGKKFGSHGAPPSFVKVWMKLIVSYGMRNPFGTDPRLVPNFTSGTREWITRYIAVYQDKNHAGQNVQLGGIAPGTQIAGTTPGVPSMPSNLKAVIGVY
jgi:hypothetical protein